MDKDGFVRTLSSLEKYMTVDESMDSYIGSESGSETKEHYHNG
jgi:hypothetical protein